MPSHSKSQSRLFRDSAHNRTFAKQAGVPMKVATAFGTADKRKGKAWQSRLPASKSS
jgi:hypothetical protein